MDIIEFHGIGIEFTYYGAERYGAERGRPTYATLDDYYVSNWDDFAAHWSATRWFGPTLQAMLDTIVDEFADKIEQEAIDCSQEPEPEYDPYEDSDYDYDDGPSCTGGDYWRNDAGEWRLG